MKAVLLQQQPHVGQVLEVALVLRRHVRIQLAAVGPALGEGQPVGAQPEARLLGTGGSHELQRAELIGEAYGLLDLVEGLLALPLRPHHPGEGSADQTPHVELLHHLAQFIRTLERPSGVVQQTPLQVDTAKHVQRRLTPEVHSPVANSPDHLPAEQ